MIDKFKALSSRYKVSFILESLVFLCLLYSKALVFFGAATYTANTFLGFSISLDFLFYSFLVLQGIKVAFLYFGDVHYSSIFKGKAYTNSPNHLSTGDKTVILCELILWIGFCVSVLTSLTFGIGV